MIDILIPVLNRPHRVAPLVKSIRDATSVEHEIVFIVSLGDEDEISAIEEHAPEALVVFLKGPLPGDYARKINAGYRQTTEPWLFQASDDLLFHPEWDTAALAVAEQTGKGVIGTNDMGNPLTIRGRHATHSLIARWYADEYGTIDQPGQILHEGYHHCWVDNELVGTAQARGQFVFAFGSCVEHLHPIWHKGPADDTYRRGQEHYREDQLYFNRNRRPLWAKGGRRR